MTKDPYKILQISPDAEIEVIDAAYRILAKKYHPDRYSGGDANVRMTDINWAYDILKNPQTRKSYSSPTAQPDKPPKPQPVAKRDPPAAHQTPPPAKEDQPSSTDDTRTYHLTFCQECRRNRPTKYVEFYQNIGILFLRFTKSVKGQMCKECINTHFWSLTFVTLALGWWGVISFFITPFILLNNTARYIGSWGMKPTYSDAKDDGDSSINIIIPVVFVIAIIFPIIIITYQYNLKTTSSSPVASGNYQPAAPTSILRSAVVRSPTPQYQLTAQANQAAVKANSTKNPQGSIIKTDPLLDCVEWDKVTKEHVGYRICVYGKIVKINSSGKYIQILRFSGEAGTFLARGEDYVDDFQRDMCVRLEGNIQRETTYIYMELDKNTKVVPLDASQCSY